jgi:hypothetical protein
MIGTAFIWRDEMKRKPVPPEELQIYQILHGRKNLSRTEEVRYHYALKGYEGEVKFAHFIEVSWMVTLLLYQLAENTPDFSRADESASEALLQLCQSTDIY